MNVFTNTVERSGIGVSLSDYVYLQVKKSIICGEYIPGEFLHEDFIASVTGASRTPIREALLKLQGDGLVELIPRRGARVYRLKEQTLSDLLQMQILFETAIFDGNGFQDETLTSLKESHEILQKISVEMSSLECGSDAWLILREEYVKLGFSFHRCLVEALNNRILLDAYDTIISRIRTYFNFAIIGAETFSEVCSQDHEKILTTIHDGYLTEAKNLHIDHLCQMNQLLTAAITDLKN